MGGRGWHGMAWYLSEAVSEGETSTPLANVVRGLMMGRIIGVDFEECLVATEMFQYPRCFYCVWRDVVLLAASL